MMYWMVSHTMHCATTLCPWESVVAQRLCYTSSVDDVLDDQLHNALRDHSLPLGERGRVASLLYIISG